MVVDNVEAKYGSRVQAIVIDHSAASSRINDQLAEGISK
jgi:hypothetical protein